MDVLNCDTYNVNGRVYRRNVPLNTKLGYGLKGDFDLPDEVEDDEYDSDLEYEGNVDNVGDEIVDKKVQEVVKAPVPEVVGLEDEEHYPIKFDAKKRAFIAEITVPEELLGKLIGNKGSNKKQIEDDTCAKIQIPKRGESGPIVIASPSKESVERCYDRIELIIFDNRRRLKFTHFVLIPIDNAEIMAAHEKLVDNIRSSSKVDESCRDPYLFVAPNRLHLTLAPMWLLSPADVKKAQKAIKQAIQEFKSKDESKDPLSVSIKGLSCFGDEEVEHIRVVYGKVQSPRVQQLADMICQALIKSGQTEQPRGGSVKLHMTVLNTRYLATDEDYDKKYIDGTGLLNEFGNFDHGSTLVDKIQVSAMSAVDVNTGSYPVLFFENL